MIRCNLDEMEIKGTPGTLLSETTHLLREVSSYVASILEVPQRDVVDVISDMAIVTHEEAMKDLREGIRETIEGEDFKNLSDNSKKAAIAVFNDLTQIINSKGGTK